jgi:hypothetical protein
MRPYTRLYMTKMGYDESDFIPCEICKAKAVDIHHINARGMGGTGTNDTIENLMALCRTCHVKYGDKKKFIDILQSIHNEMIANITKRRS